VLVKQTLVETSNSGMRYTPQALRTRFIDGGCGATLLRYAPTLPKPEQRKARNLPSLSSASSDVISWSRPWWSERNEPERSSVHFTGRLSARAACARQMYSG